ncbi:acetate kinase [Marvinbryantia formatexigens DSM 14469]|uniref:Acetate kinase n=1 Tax=Marvinbryantia formatexigens DSM 14469 TaxID=478749 RepID=C6LCP9_9FIRM|nr:acetate kinase [Marvinbryantia formatexigens]EET61713.1 acetate kinase [Marvinbryantia formatexigens DSM 14469]UWO24473.1 acetate kinase [Marvinbryantia formatexigens DSM 14469]SDF09482.1 acetate kinase [Marvinbryantia formatexigens]
MNVLVINCGSSSLKYQLINSDSEEVLAKGLCERIGIDGRLVYQKAGCDKEITEAAMPTHKQAIQMVLDALVNEKTGAIKSLKEVEAVGHRVVHGGEKFASSVVINDEVLKAIEECNDLAPLHNPANLIGINACAELMPGVPMVAVFDTAFHQTMPEKAYLYGLPYEYYEKYAVRRYGFHGTSHSFVSKHAAEFLGLDLNDSKIIVAHLGNGASISAVQNGKCVDTSMGLTPLEGLVMGTRSGDIDPAIMEYIAKKENLDIAGVMNVLNKKSGVFGISKELSSDFRDLEDAMNDGNKYAAAAIEVFSYRVAKYIGSYVAAMNGVDAIAFTAGIGENAPLVREKVLGYLGYLGITLDAEENKKRGEDLVISTADSKVKVAVIPTNEELAICRETVALV